MSQFSGYDRYELVADLYDYVPGYVDRPDIDFYLRAAESASGHVLELGCGTGRVLIPTAIAGVEITGLDLSGHMLARCREKLSRQPKEIENKVKLVQANMTEFDLQTTFSLVTTPFRSFQHLVDVEDQLSCLRNVNRHLIGGGKLILDLFNTDPRRILYDAKYTVETEDFQTVELPDGTKFRRIYRIAGFHRAAQYNDIELIYYLTNRTGETQRLVQGFPMRYFFRYEVEHLIARCGFKVVDVFGNYDKSPYTDESPETIIVAEKCNSSESC
jgi:SAM-dependent methyltransferase